jgi:HAD superfamily hydrolase (TIGR01509 family)
MLTLQDELHHIKVCTSIPPEASSDSSTSTEAHMELNRSSMELRSKRGALRAAILDVDGVLLASPHERAWREALPSNQQDRFTTAMYQAHVAGKPRLDGAIAALKALGMPDSEKQVSTYVERKQTRLEELIHAGHIAAFPDALRFVQAVQALRWPMAVASSSKNANSMLQAIRLDSGQTLFDVFRVNICGRDLRQGKPNPEIFLLAATELQVPPEHCFVAEDATAGIEAACAGRMKALGVARLGDSVPLRAAGADLVVTSLDEIDIDALAEGQLSIKEIPAKHGISFVPARASII